MSILEKTCCFKENNFLQKTINYYLTLKFLTMKTIVVLLILSYTTLSGQSNFVSSGNNTAGLEESVSYSIGQMFYNTSRDGPSQKTSYGNEGVQQPYEIFIEVLDEDDPAFKVDLNKEQPFANFYEDSELKLSVFPNPFLGQVTVSFEGELEDAQCMIMDAQGRLVLKRNLSLTQTSFDLTPFEDGMYYLTVINKNAPIKSLKLIKQSK